MPGLFLIPLSVYYGIHFYLDSSGTLWFPFLFELPLLILFLEQRLDINKKKSALLKTIALGLFALLICGFLLFILMLPESLYQAWLLLLNAGMATGMISFAFAYAGGLVSCIGCASLMMWQNKGQAVLNLLLLCVLVLLILHPGLPVFIFFILLLTIQILMIHKGSSKTVLFLSPVLILIPSLIYTVLIPVLNTDPRGSRTVDGFSSAIQSTVSRVYPGLPLLLQIPGYGYGYDQVRKNGKRPILTSNNIFTVDGEPGTVLYLRSDLFYAYREGYWIYENPGQAYMEPDNPELETLRRLTLTMETDIYTRILHNSWTSYYQLDQNLLKLDGRGSYDPPGGLPLSKGRQIRLYDNAGRAPLPDEDVLNKQIKGALTLPDEMREKLLELATSLKGGSDSQSLSNIKTYLRENFKYTLDTKSSRDLVLDFLNSSREGYCVHFSSTAALLARTLDIPVRMAEGFLVQIPETEDGESYYDSGSYSVSGYSAHQWPEIFIEGRGWIPWEVTPPFEAHGNSLVQENMEFDAFTLDQLQRMGIVVEDSEDLSESDTVFPLRLAFALLILISLSALIVCIISGLNGKRLNSLLKQKIRKAERRLGIPSPAGTGWVLWCNSFRTDNRTSKELDRCLSLILRYCYHSDKLERGEKKELMKLIREL